MKPNKNIECPPFDVLTEGFCNFICSIKGHKYEWNLTPLKQYQQEVCKRCGITGRTEKL
jgi:hypothetical protein